MDSDVQLWISLLEGLWIRRLQVRVLPRQQKGQVGGHSSPTVDWSERVSSCVTDAFDTLFEDAVEALVSGLVLLLGPERPYEGDERAGVAFAVGQLGCAVGVALEDEEVLAVDNPTETEFAEPAQLSSGVAANTAGLKTMPRPPLAPMCTVSLVPTWGVPSISM